MKIQGIEGMSPDQLRFEIQRGAKLVCYNYCISVIVMDVSPIFPGVFRPGGRKHALQRITLDSANAGDGLVGISLGTDLQHSVAGGEPQGRQRRDGGHLRVAGTEHSARSLRGESLKQNILKKNI
jgi:hypothetical protein